MFERPYHQRIALVLQALDGSLLRENSCLFGGGTALALRYGEYRESVAIDFLVSDLGGYRNLRQLTTGSEGVAAITTGDTAPFEQLREVTADQYGIRTMLQLAGKPIKFEIVLEARFVLAPPGAGDEVCGIATLTPLDLATSKLLANSDRWADDSVFTRDLIDLAMMKPPLHLLRQAVAKAEQAYGASVLRDLGKAIDAVQARRGWLALCLQALAVSLPEALLWQRIKALKRVLP